MGMYLSLAGVSDATIALIHADPPLIWQVVSPDDPEALARARTETRDIAAALGRVDDAELRRRFAPGRDDAARDLPGDLGSRSCKR
jgi:hypothetical protein